MRHAILSFCLFLGMTFGAIASEAPTLHDIEIEGSPANPQLSFHDLKLEINHEYLFVLNNTHPVPFVFQFEKLGQHVATRYLQGSPSVTQESLNVLPNAKVIWHFLATSSGEFTVHLINPSTLQKGEARKIVIIDPVKQAELEKVAAIAVAKKKEKPKFRSKIKG